MTCSSIIEMRSLNYGLSYYGNTFSTDQMLIVPLSSLKGGCLWFSPKFKIKSIQ